MTWLIHTTNKESNSLVISKTRQKPYLERKLSNHLSSLLFHSKVSSSLLFHSKLPLFYSKLAFFDWNCRALLFHFFKTVTFPTFSLKTIKFATFIENCLVCQFFKWHCRARYFYLFSIVMGSLLFHSNPPTLSLSFDPACYFFTGNDLARYFLFEIVKFATFFNLKVVKNTSLPLFYPKRTKKMLFK